MSKTSDKNIKKVKLVTFRQIIPILIGLLLMGLTGLFGFYAGEKEFFKLTFSVGKGGHFNSFATTFLAGLIIFCFGLYDILKNIYFLRTLKHEKK